jgi:hypothetical protein
MINLSRIRIACSIIGIACLCKPFTSGALASGHKVSNSSQHHSVPQKRSKSFSHRKSNEKRVHHLPTINIEDPAACLKDKAMCAIAKKLINEQIKTFRSNSESAEDASPPGYLKGHCAVGMNNTKLMSALFTFDSYIAGSANSSQSIEVLNIWKKSTKKIENNEIIAPDSTKDLAVLLASAAYHQTGNETDALKLFKIEEFDKVVLTHDGISFLFREGDLGATAEGILQVKLLYTTVGLSCNHYSAPK